MKELIIGACHVGNSKIYYFKTTLSNIKKGDTLHVKTKYGLDSVVADEYSSFHYPATSWVVGIETKEVTPVDCIVESSSVVNVVKSISKDRNALSHYDRLKEVVSGVSKGDILEVHESGGAINYLLMAKNVSGEWVALNLRTGLVWRTAGRNSNSLFNTYFGSKVGSTYLDIILHTSPNIELNIKEVVA